MTDATCPEDTYVTCGIPATPLPDVTSTVVVSTEPLPATGQSDPTTALGVSLFLIALGLIALTLGTIAHYRRADREDAEVDE